MGNSGEKAAIIKGPNDLVIYHRGPPLTGEPRPAVFYFALSGEDSLCKAPFNHPVEILIQKSIHVFSFDLPFHDGSLDYNTAFLRWPEELLKGNNIIAAFLTKCYENILFLISGKMVQPETLAVCGISRGGFIASHLASFDERISSILAFAPMIKFKNEIESSSRLADSLALNRLTPLLIRKKVRFYIGNRDMRVGTRHCFDFIHQLAEENYKNGVRSPPVELIVGPSIGHKGHGTPPHVFENGAGWLFDILTSG